MRILTLALKIKSDSTQLRPEFSLFRFEEGMLMLPTIKGEIVRRILINYRADPTVIAKLLPPSFELDLREGFAVVGICVIELAHLRPVGLPAWTGLSLANAAYRVAVRFPKESSHKDRAGVYIWRRDTNSRLVSMLGGRAFPGVHGRAGVAIDEQDEMLGITVRTPRHDGDVSYSGRRETELGGSSLFKNLSEASAFFQRGDCGYSCSRSGRLLEGMRLSTESWSMHPLATQRVESTFCGDRQRFPAGSIQFDSALLMENVPHHWESIGTMRNEPV
jgi:hypothetical protein